MFVGMDVHKESIDISLAEEGRDGEVRYSGGIAGDLEALAKLVKALRAPNRRLRFVYEAGPCGCGIHRYLTAQGEERVVVNPSSMPKRSGGITKEGNPHARRLLAEAAWAYQGMPRTGRQMLYRQEGLPKSVCAIALEGATPLDVPVSKAAGAGESEIQEWPRPSPAN
jgi:transposase